MTFKRLFLVALVVLVSGCSTVTLKKHDDYKNTSIQQIRVFKPHVLIDQIQGRKISPDKQACKEAAQRIDGEIKETLASRFELKAINKLTKKTRESIYNTFAKLDTVLVRGGLYDSEKNVNQSHLDSDLNDLAIDPFLLKKIRMYDEDYFLIVFQDGILRDKDLYQHRVSSAAEVIADLSDALKVDNNVIYHYSYLAVALVEKENGHILYYNKNYQHQDPRSEALHKQQVQLVLDALQNKN